MPNTDANTRGFSLLELLVASFIGLLIVSGILYLYKNQHKRMLVSNSTVDLRMNGQYALNEAQYHILHAGMGLPQGFRDLDFSDGHLVVKMNPTKKGFPATKHPSSNASRTDFRLDLPQDRPNFQKIAFVLVRGRNEEYVVKSFDGEKVRIEVDEATFPATVTLYPMERVILKQDGDFRIAVDDPNGLVARPSLRLAEGIESLSYRFKSQAGTESASLPASLDTLKQIEIRVVARSLYKDAQVKDDGYRRMRFATVLGYRRSL